MMRPRPTRARGSSDRLMMALALTVRLGSFDALPMAGNRRGDGERDGLGARQRTRAFGWAPSNPILREPGWTTPNRVALELPSMCLREFSSDGDDIASLVCAPLAVHDATLTDFAPDHSLVAALRMAGLRNVFVTDWRSASPEMRLFS